MNKKLLQRGLRVCLMMLVLVVGCATFKASTIEAEAAAKGFTTKNGSTYYVTSSGKYKTGWLTLNGKKYYFKSNGKMATGWQTISGKKYYFKKSTGVMATGWGTINGKKYYFKKNTGVMATGWLTLNNKRYYMGTNGVMRTGWLKNSKGQYRYFGKTDGVMATGWLKNSSGQYRYFSKSTGVMATGWQKNSAGEYRYFDTSNGVMKTGKCKIGNYYYYLKKKNGVRYQKGFGTISGKKYYFSPSNGRMVTGWLKLNSKKYYFDSNGVMYADKTATIDGVKYTFASDGAASVYVANSDAGKTGLTVVAKEDTYVMVKDSGRSSTREYKLDINYLKHDGVADGTLSDLDILAAVCDAEAGDQGLVGMEAVAMCVLNRTLDSYYPASVRGVVYQKAPGIQYSVVIDGALERRLVRNSWEAKTTAYKAAQAALDMFAAYKENGTKRTLKGFDRKDFNFKFFMTEAAFWAQNLNFDELDYFKYKDHVFFVEWK